MRFLFKTKNRLSAIALAASLLAAVGPANAAQEISFIWHTGGKEVQSGTFPYRDGVSEHAKLTIPSSDACKTSAIYVNIWRVKDRVKVATIFEKTRGDASSVCGRSKERSKVYPASQVTGKIEVKDAEKSILEWRVTDGAAG